MTKKSKIREMTTENVGFWSFNIRMIQKKKFWKKYDAFYNSVAHELTKLQYDPKNTDYETLFAYAPTNCLILRFLSQKIIKAVNLGTIKDDQARLTLSFDRLFQSLVSMRHQPS